MQSTKQFLIFALISILSCAPLSPKIHPRDPLAPLNLLAFGSCLNQNLPQAFWKPLLRLNPQVFIFLGDNVYSSDKNINSLHTHYKKLASNTNFIQLKSQSKILATWDDHDFGLSDGGEDYSLKHLSKNEFLNFFQVPTQDSRWHRDGIYSSEIIGPPGKRTQIILLDTRTFRSPLNKKDPSCTPIKSCYIPNTDKDTTILGPTQWQWFKEQLLMPTELRIIVTSIQVISEEHGFEKWANFPHEQERLFKLLTQTEGIGKVIILSGDRHHAELSRRDDILAYPLYEFTSSSLNMDRLQGQEKNQYRLGPQVLTENFGVVRILWKGNTPRICFKIHSSIGEIVFRHCQN